MIGHKMNVPMIQHIKSNEGKDEGHKVMTNDKTTRKPLL